MEVFLEGETMSAQETDHITARITGDIGGQVALGSSIRQIQHVEAAGGPAAIDVEAVRAVLAVLRSDIARVAPEELRDGALERVQELGWAILSEQPDVTTISYVSRWFTRRAPGLAALVARAFADPSVARLLDGARNGLARELRASLGG